VAAFDHGDGQSQRVRVSRRPLNRCRLAVGGGLVEARVGGLELPPTALVVLVEPSYMQEP
jgi:hypothetical protein